MCLCVCVYISAGKRKAGPTVHVSTAKSSTLLIQPSRDVVVFFSVHVCVQLKNFCQKVVMMYCKARQKSVWKYFQPDLTVYGGHTEILKSSSSVHVMLISSGCVCRYFAMYLT